MSTAIDTVRIKPVAQPHVISLSTTPHRPCANARSISCRCRDSALSTTHSAKCCWLFQLRCIHSGNKGKRATRAHRRSINVASFFPSFTVPPFVPRRAVCHLRSFLSPFLSDFYSTVSSAGSAATACSVSRHTDTTWINSATRSTPLSFPHSTPHSLASGNQAWKSSSGPDLPAARFPATMSSQLSWTGGASSVPIWP